MSQYFLIAALAIVTTAQAQQSMGTIATHDASISGGLEVHNDRARLITNASITAYDHTAAIQLDRGGNVLVCATSDFHLLHSGTNASLLFGLDRGAIELHGPSSPQDVVLTPDIRFTLENPGTFDFRLRVTRNGDTCVDNAGASAPVLILSDPFSSAIYRIIPGQHVLFEHGSLHEVVDHERSNCGCPVETAPVLGANATPAQITAAGHPFPVAASQDLEPTQAVGNTTAGQAEAQVSVTLRAANGFVLTAPEPPEIPPSSPPSTSTATTAPPPSPPGVHDLAHAIGHFFHKLFHPKSEGRPL